jgi:hypothetical protein
MEWKENGLGLLVPSTRYSYGSKTPPLNRLRKVLGSKYLLDRSRRQIRAGEKVPSDLSPWDPSNIRRHVRGRKWQSVLVLLGVAFLRKMGFVNRDDVVDYEGAEYQKGKGSTEYPAAHQFPCNPTIRGFGLPHHARTAGLKSALKRPFEETDYLPKLVNYADRLFEANGACDAVVNAVKFVLHEQPADKDVNLTMIRHASICELFKGYANALDSALALAEANTVGIDMLDPEVLEHVNETWFSGTGEISQKAQKSIEVVRAALDYAKNASLADGEPDILTPAAMNVYLYSLETLSREI